MPIFRAIGFGILLIILRIMIPSVLSEGEQTAISFLHGARVSADTMSQIAGTAGSASVSLSSLPPLTYPQATTIPLSALP
ncbi:MAG: hypothetical protein JWN49_613 [Parcubacteria group bacterium]|nr:hypothetical protein [Parcubacteria group bacterium]